MRVLMRMQRVWILLFVTACLLSVAGCGSKHRYPDPLPGWHASDYSVIFGRLQRVPGKNPEDPPLWVILYGFGSTDGYGGKLNLAPPEKMTGYRGGEQVEIRGGINTEYAHPDFPGAWYEVQAIRYWTGQSPK